MDKVEMTRAELVLKFGTHALCDVFCTYGRARTYPQICDEMFKVPNSIHCEKAKKALADDNNIKLIKL